MDISLYHHRDRKQINITLLPHADDMCSCEKDGTPSFSLKALLIRTKKLFGD